MDAEISAGSFGRCPAAGESFQGGGGGGGGTPTQEANGDVLLDGVAFSQLEWVNFRILGVSRDPKWEDSRLKKSESCCLLNLTIRLHWLHYILPLETTLIR